MRPININGHRPVEALVGANRGIVRQRLGNFHVGHSILAAARHARPASLRSAPVALRRGWVLCVLETWREYRGTYEHVMYGR